MQSINSNSFDFLRFVFATTVAVSHLITLSGVDAFLPYQIYFNSRLAIDGFFIISGFLIAKSYENSSSIKDYIIRRIKRIVPAYVFVIIVFAFAFSLISSYGIKDYFVNHQFWKYLGVNLVFQNYLEPCLPGVFLSNNECAVNGALWTIKLEEAFYLTVPLIYWLLRKKNINHILLYSLIFVLSILYFNYFVSINKYRIAKQLPGAMAFFCFGMLLFKYFNFFLRKKHLFVLPCLFLFFIEQYLFKTHILKPATFGFLVFYAAYSFSFLKNFGKYGDFTYGIYIYHFPLIQLFTHLGLYQKHNPFFVGLLTIAITFVLAVFSWHIIELPNLPKSRQLRQKGLQH